MCRVLILDDEKTFAEYIKLILEEANEAQPDISTTPEEAEERVRSAMRRGKPYEVLLIDQRLGNGRDGIETMKELRSLSPDSDAIILTGFDDTANGVRAYEAGAFRYLSKSFEQRELIFLFKAIKQWRKEQREHGWQKVFSAMMEEALSKEAFGDVAAIVVKYAIQLGFERAHLFWVPTREDANRNNQMVGITCAGRDCIPDFSNNKRLYPIRRWFDIAQAGQGRTVIFMRPEESEKAKAEAAYCGYHWPSGENVILPLWSGTRLLGALMLDHNQQLRSLSEHERQLLNLFARQVSLSLENASLFIREKRSLEETAIISAIGQHVTARAAIEDLNTLLEVVRSEVGRLINTSSFSVVLIDNETNELDFHLFYEENQRQTGVRKPLNTGLEGYLMSHPAGLFLPDKVAQFIRKNGIQVTGKTPSSWMGVALKVSDNIIGGIVLQYFRDEEKFTTRDWQLLQSVANQIAGAIALSQINESEKRDAERLNILRRSSMDMLRVARENEDHLWTLTITLATAQFGTGFNRGLLFLEDETHTNLVLKSAIGTEDTLKAHRDWERDIENSYTFDKFLEDLKNGCVPQTDFATLAGQIVIPLDDTLPGVFKEVRHTRQVKIIPHAEVTAQLPSQLTACVQLSTCAILPINAGQRTIGLMLVDNKHNQHRLGERPLGRLQTILNYAGLVWETLRQRKKSDNLLDANYQILGNASKDALKKTLTRICQTARAFSEADWVIIYPLKQGEDGFDKANISYDGQLQYPLEEKVKDKPRKRGVSRYVLDNRELVVPNIHDDQTLIDTHFLAEHHFIQREGVQSLIGVAITQAATEELLGVLYLDYRKPRQFGQQEIHHAHSFASLAGVAIANARRFDQERQRLRLQAALDTAKIISKSIALDDMLTKVLDNLSGLFKGAAMCVLTYYPEENALRFVPGTLKYYRSDYTKDFGDRPLPLRGQSIACRIARETLKKRQILTLNEPDVSHSKDYLQVISKTRSELCVSLVDSSKNKELLGVLALERPVTYGFDEGDEALIRLIASQLSLGMERIRNNEDLDYSNTVSALTAWAADIAHDIKSEVGIIKDSAYLIREFAGDHPGILENLSEIEKSAEKLALADPQKSKPRLALRLDDLLQKYGQELSQEKDVEVQYELRARDYYVKVNPLVFRRMLRNLISNASRAMENKEQKKVKIRSRKFDGSRLEIQFQDFGSGIPDNIRNDIFRKKTTTKKGGEGGHGLLFCRQAVEEMDGKIRLLHTQPDEGTTFSIVLPIYNFTDSLPE